MPARLTIKNGNVFLVEQSHAEVMLRIDNARLVTGLAERDPFVEFTLGDEFGARRSLDVSLRIGEIASVVDSPTRPRI